MTIFNLTNDPSLMPTGEAIDLVRDILNSQCFDDHFFHERMHFFHDNPLFRTHVYGPECTDYELSEQIPLFIVNREISGRNVYSRILQREIPVPKDFLPNIRISKSSEEENHDNQDRRDREERYDRRYRDEEPNQTVRFSVDERVQFIDVWGMFTILHDYANKTEMSVIFIWMDKIQEAVNHDRNTEWLFAKVYVHELAHALMHTGYYSNDDFYKWREESLANAYALSKISSYISGCNDDYPHPHHYHYAPNKYHKDYGLLEFAKQVMRKQPDNYKLGIKIFEDLCGHHGCYEIFELMGNWRVIKRKRSLPPKELQDEWFKAVQTPNELDWETISDLDSYMEDECYKYNKKLYGSKRDVVFQVIKDYVNNNPGTSADLNIAFPATLNSKYNVFATWPKAANYDGERSIFEKSTPNHLYYNTDEDSIINLADGRLVVCDGWENDDFKIFVENANNLGYDIEILVD